MTKTAYFIGIKGVGMTSLALAMQEAGWAVAGCDTDETFITDSVLSARDIPIFPPDSPVPADTTLIIYSAAYSPPQSSIRTLPLAVALAEFVQSRRVIAVAGVGGKTTTSAMLAVLLNEVNRDVGYYVGTSTIAGLTLPGHSGSDPYYVVEADEYAISKTDYRPKFTLLNPEIVVTTNIVHDHPDIYPTVAHTLSAFSELIKKIPAHGTWVYNSADPLTQTLLKDLSPQCRLAPYASTLPPLTLSVFGAQNQLDAQAAVLAAQAAGVSPARAIHAIKAFQGASRRQESHGEHAGRLLYDDYGHHPDEIKITIAAFKAHFPKRRLHLIFESHTYTRTESLISDFTAALATADKAYIMPIFESAREKGQPHTITPESFASLIPGALAVTWENAVTTVWERTQPGDIILTMGAGFVYKLHDQFLKLPQNNSNH